MSTPTPLAFKTSSSGRQANILVVDDHPANLLALEEILRPLGQRVVRAQSGVEALKQVLSFDFAAILMDVRMPGLEIGRASCRERV